MDRHELLISKPVKLDSLEALLKRCLPRLTARIWEVCSWPEFGSGQWNIGDFRFIIAEFNPSGDEPVSLYVQIWSEPFEPASMEVSSGHMNAAAVAHVWREQRQALRERGFEISGGARNFGKEVLIASIEDAEQVATEFLAIFFEVLGYRGRQPLSVRVHHGTRADQKPVHTSVTPGDFMKLAAACGFRTARITEEEGFPVVAMERRGLRAIASLGSQIPGNNLFTSIVITPVANTLAERDRPVGQRKRHIEDAPSAVLVLEGGVTADWILSAINRWRTAAVKHQRTGIRLAKQPPRGGRSRSGGLPIH